LVHGMISIGIAAVSAAVWFKPNDEYRKAIYISMRDNGMLAYDATMYDPKEVK